MKSLSSRINEFAEQAKAINKFAGKYDHIDFVPPDSVAKAAERGLELRKKNRGNGGLSTQQAAAEVVGSGVARATSLKNKKKLSPETVKRMKAFFSRHEKNKNPKKANHYIRIKDT